MTKNKFSPTEGLLEDVMRKQAGTVEKAVLEAVMNSVDAGATEVIIEIGSNEITVQDDGTGIKEDEVEKYFEQFGLKDSDIEEKEFGKFRMGRGQIFNFGKNIWRTQDNIMVVDLNKDMSWFQLPNAVVEEDDESVIEHNQGAYRLDTEGLSYVWLKSEDYTEGCSITVDLYNLIDVEEKTDEIRDLIKYIPWVHNVEVTLNGEDILAQFSPHFETDLAWYRVDERDYVNSISIYNKGAYVKSERLTSCKGAIVTKKDLDVNFSRNDILENDDYWESVKQEYVRFTLQKLKNAEELTNHHMKWVLNKMVEDVNVLQMFWETELFEDVLGNSLSLVDIQNEKVTYASSANEQAKELMRDTGSIVVDDEYQERLSDVIERHNQAIEAEGVSYQEAVGDMKWEMEEYDYSDLNKTRQRNFDMAEFFLKKVGFRGDVKPGYSQHADAWKDDEDTLYINKSFLKGGKKEFVVVKLDTILEVVAQGGDTRNGLEHGYQFNRQFWKYAKKAGKVKLHLLENGV